MSFLKHTLDGKKSEVLSIRAFVSYFADHLAKQTQCPVRVNQEKKSWDVVLPNQRALRFSIDKIYKQLYLAHPSQEALDNLIAQYANMVLNKCKESAQKEQTVIYASQEEEEKAVVAANIFPVLRKIDYLNQFLEMANEHGVDQERHICHQKFLDGVFLSFVEDQGEYLRDLRKNDVEALGMRDNRALYHLARSNFKQYVEGRNLPIQTSTNQNSLLRVILDGTFDASLILLAKDIIEQLPKMTGYPVMAIPARDVFLICDSEDQSALHDMRETVKMVLQQSEEPISDTFFCWQEEKIKLFK